MRRLSTLDNRRSSIAARRSGFTLVEMLVVIGIIAGLIAILFPTIRRIRIAGQEADTRSLLNAIDQACLAYHTAFQAYPGPLPSAMLSASDQSSYLAAPTPIYDSLTGTTEINANLATYGTATTATTFGPATETRITGAENLVLGLCGGLAFDRATSRYYYDAAALGQGTANFNPLRPGRSAATMQPIGLSKGRVTDEGGTATTGIDSIIPEFVDRFGTPMPFLYMRSRMSGTTASGAETLVVNNATATADYNIVEIQPYTSYPTGGTSNHGLTTANPLRTITSGTAITGVTYQTPFDAYDYFVDPASYDHTQPTLSAAGYAGKRSRKRESFVLISAGRDRVYGTADDIANFGVVLP